jgi:hypothetical protein
MNSWQLIFLQSKVNNGLYYGDLFPAQNWDWPEETWFQKRLRDLRRSNGKLAEELADQDLQ